jgi:hypothetical protein
MDTVRFHPYLKVVLLALFALGVVYAFAAPVRSLIYVFSDDAYYYFGVARNILAGQGSTFDGFNQTNGYHPIWMLVLLPVVALTKGGSVLSLRAILALVSILGAFSWLLCWTYIRTTGTRYMALIGTVLLLSSPALLLMLNGLESGLLIFWIFLMLFLDLKYDLLADSSSAGSKFLLGVLFAVLVLIRIDSAFFVLALVVFKLIFASSRRPVDKVGFLVRSYWPAIVIFCVLVVPYFVYNFLTYGHLFPISGTLKTSFPVPDLNPPNAHTAVYVFGILVSLIWVVISALSPRGYLRSTLLPRWRHDTSYAMLAIIWLGCLFHMVWTAMFMQWGVYQWHYSSYVPILAILPAFAVRGFVARFGHGGTIRGLALCLALLFTVGVSVFAHLEKGSHLIQRYQGAVWAKNHTTGNTVFAMHDAGCFAYLAERPTVNLDGVINSFEYQDAIRDGRLREFLDNLNVRYIVSAAVDYDKRDFTKRIRYYVGKRRGERIWYKVSASQDAEVFATKPRVYRPLTQHKEVSLIIWDFSKVELERVVRP